MSNDDNIKDLRYEHDYYLDKIRSYCTEGQLSLYRELKKEIKEEFKGNLTKAQKKFLTFSTYMRYLRARSWDVKKAKKMLIETIKWRDEYKPYSIRAKDIVTELNHKGKMYRGGFDKLNRPLILMKPRYDNTGSDQAESKIKYLVYIVEKAISAAEQNNREKIVLFMDFHKFTSSSGTSIKIALDVLSILTNHYPERLGGAYIMNTPWAFTLFWKVVSPFLDDVTKKKIRFIKKYEELLEYIDKSELEAEYGGENQFVYDFETHFLKEDKEFPPYDDDLNPIPIEDN